MLRSTQVLKVISRFRRFFLILAGNDFFFLLFWDYRVLAKALQV
jgi:hypothetical protein